MAHRQLIRSRRGNVLFGLLGATYLLVALTLIGVLLYSTHAQQTFAEIIIEAILISCAVTGFWFATESARNLRHH